MLGCERPRYGVAHGGRFKGLTGKRKELQPLSRADLQPEAPLETPSWRAQQRLWP